MEDDITMVVGYFAWIASFGILLALCSELGFTSVWCGVFSLLLSFAISAGVMWLFYRKPVERIEDIAKSSCEEQETSSHQKVSSEGQNVFFDSKASWVGRIVIYQSDIVIGNNDIRRGDPGVIIEESLPKRIHVLFASGFYVISLKNGKLPAFLRDSGKSIPPSDVDRIKSFKSFKSFKC